MGALRPGATHGKPRVKKRDFRDSESGELTYN